jgi:hypothetical protein
MNKYARTKLRNKMFDMYFLKAGKVIPKHFISSVSPSVALFKHVNYCVVFCRILSIKRIFLNILSKAEFI